MSERRAETGYVRIAFISDRPFWLPSLAWKKIPMIFHLQTISKADDWTQIYWLPPCMTRTSVRPRPPLCVRTTRYGIAAVNLSTCHDRHRKAMPLVTGRYQSPTGRIRIAILWWVSNLFVFTLFHRRGFSCAGLRGVRLHYHCIMLINVEYE